MSKLQEIIKSIRTANRLSQIQFAEKIGMKQSAYSMLESGVNKPTLEVLSKIIEVFGVPSSVFFEQKNNIVGDDNLTTLNGYLNGVENGYLNSKNEVKPQQNYKEHINQFFKEAVYKRPDALANYYATDPVGIQTKKLMDLKEKYTRRFNREAVKEDEELYDFSNMVDHLGDTIEMVLDVYIENINSRPDPFETTQYFDLQNDSFNAPDTIDYEAYKQSVIKWLESIRVFEPVINEYYKQSLAFLASIEKPASK